MIKTHLEMLHGTLVGEEYLPQGSTEVLLSYMYTQAFKFLDFGYGTAVGLLMGVGVVVLSFLQRRMMRGSVEY